MKIVIPCICGERFEYEIDENMVKGEFSGGVVPLLVPHKDHFVTVYLDRKFGVRGVEKVIFIKKTHSVVVSSPYTRKEIEEILEELLKKYNYKKNYPSFVANLALKMNSPEGIFYAGRIIGYKEWLKLKEYLLKIGGEYELVPEEILKSEIFPLVKKLCKTKLVDKGSCLIADKTIIPQFIIGIAQGILDAILEKSGGEVEIKVQYEIIGEKVILKLI